MICSVRSDAGERIVACLDELGINRAHFLGGWGCATLLALHEARPGAIASATLVCPSGVDERFLHAHGEHLLAFFGSTPDPGAEQSRGIVRSLAGARVEELPAGYPTLLWSDIAADHAELIREPLVQFVRDVEAASATEPVAPRAGGTSQSGITFRVHGSGVPVIFTPYGLAPSQWGPLIAALGEGICAIEFGGRHVGIPPIHYGRVASPTYGTVVQRLIDRLTLRPGQRVLEVGVGVAPIALELARRAPDARVVGVDVNDYLLHEATEITRAEGYGSRIEIRKGDATALPFDDHSFDAAYSATVFEELDADAGIAELVRVTKPGGRIGVIVRSNDLPQYWHLDLPPAVRSELNAPQSGPVAGNGCADASLYERFEAAGIRDVEALPTWGTERPPTWWLTISTARARLSLSDAALFDQALEAGTREQTAFVSEPFHLAVGTRPTLP
jgi:SAM-dependent methyltransferase